MTWPDPRFPYCPWPAARPEEWGANRTVWQVTINMLTGERVSGFVEIPPVDPDLGEHGGAR